jgi:hypothetical protein
MEQTKQKAVFGTEKLNNGLKTVEVGLGERFTPSEYGQYLAQVKQALLVGLAVSAIDEMKAIDSEAAGAEAEEYQAQGEVLPEGFWARVGSVLGSERAEEYRTMELMTAGEQAKTENASENNRLLELEAENEELKRKLEALEAPQRYEPLSEASLKWWEEYLRKLGAGEEMAARAVTEMARIVGDCGVDNRLTVEGIFKMVNETVASSGIKISRTGVENSLMGTSDESLRKIDSEMANKVLAANGAKWRLDDSQERRRRAGPENEITWKYQIDAEEERLKQVRQEILPAWLLREKSSGKQGKMGE